MRGLIVKPVRRHSPVTSEGQLLSSAPGCLEMTKQAPGNGLCHHVPPGPRPQREESSELRGFEASRPARSGVKVLPARCPAHSRCSNSRGQRGSLDLGDQTPGPDPAQALAGCDLGRSDGASEPRCPPVQRRLTLAAALGSSGKQNELTVKF